MTTSLLTCDRCGSKNRLMLGGPSVKRSRCGKCKHEFTPRELMKAVVERPAAPEFTGADDYDLEPTEDIEWECPEGACGWYGAAQDANTDANNTLTCPSCGTKLEKAKDVE